MQPTTAAVERRRRALQEAEEELQQRREEERSRSNARVERERERREQEKRNNEEAGQEGYREALHDEENNIVDENDDNFRPSRSRGGRNREEDQDGIPVIVPKNLLELTANIAVTEGLTERQHQMMTAAFYRCCKPISNQHAPFPVETTGNSWISRFSSVFSSGVDLEQVFLSNATAHQARLRQCSQVQIQNFEHYSPFH